MSELLGVENPTFGVRSDEVSRGKQESFVLLEIKRVRNKKYFGELEIKSNSLLWQSLTVSL